MVCIQQMSKSHYLRVQQILSACFHWLAGRERWDEDQLAFMMSDQTPLEVIENVSAMQDCWVALQDDLVVGLVSVKKNQIAKLYVDPEYHRSGIGTQLFRTAENAIRQAGYKDMRLSSPETSVSFYKAMGMSVMGRKAWKGEAFSGREVVLMKKEFSRSQ